MNEIEVINTLKEVYDPEIPLNIVDLGLVKGVKIEDKKLTVIMTLTTPDCPLEKYIIKTVTNHLQKHLKNFEEISIKMDFSEPWNTGKISSEGIKKLRELGWNI